MELSENQRLYEIFLPELRRSRRRVYYMLGFIDVVGVALILSNIFTYAKITIFVTFVIINVVAIFSQRATVKKFHAAFKHPSSPVLARFGLVRLGKGFLTQVHLQSGSETTTFDCSMGNIDYMTIGEPLDCVLFTKGDRPVLVINEALKLFAVMG